MNKPIPTRTAIADRAVAVAQCISLIAVVLSLVFGAQP